MEKKDTRQTCNISHVQGSQASPCLQSCRFQSALPLTFRLDFLKPSFQQVTPRLGSWSNAFSWAGICVFSCPAQQLLQILQYRMVSWRRSQGQGCAAERFTRWKLKIDSCVWCLGGCWRLLSEAFLLQFWEWMTDYEALLEKKRVGTGFWSAEEKKTNASCLVKLHAVKFLFHTMICLPNIYSFIPHIFVEYLLCIGVVVEKTQWLLIYTRFCLQIITKEWWVWQERRKSVLTEAQAKGI